MTDDHIRLSPSTIGLAKECSRCFWLTIREKIRRPSGPFPSLPGGMDGIIKDYFDIYRVKDEMPPEIAGKIEGKLYPDKAKLDVWRNWRTGLKFYDENLNATLSGALDDLLVDGDKYMPLDYKTRGYPLKPDAINYYQHQMDLYSLMLEENDMPTNGYAYLLYFYPSAVEEAGLGLVKFEVEPKKEEASVERARELFTRAAKIARGDIPPSHSGCSFCNWQASLLFLE